jgi:hypothetical protein
MGPRLMQQIDETVPSPSRSFKSELANLLRKGIVSKRRGSPHRSGRSRHLIKSNPTAPAVKREAEQDWGNTKSH